MKIEEVSAALDELKHGFALALDVALRFESGECQNSVEMLSAYEDRLMEIRNLKQTLSAT